ncbi:SVEP1 [Symbiodinium sp. CCMP2456]|nr:SVEP1 [Symbiodinium sp. CCMP2456]
MASDSRLRDLQGSRLFLSHRYGWCEVDDKLPCASANTPRWDYCVGQGPQDDPEVPLESEMGAVLLRYGLFVVAGLLSLAALLFLRHYLPVRPGPVRPERPEAEPLPDQTCELPAIVPTPPRSSTT